MDQVLIGAIDVLDEHIRNAEVPVIMAWSVVRASVNQGAPAVQPGNSRYVTALDVLTEFNNAGPHPFGTSQFRGWLTERLNAQNDAHCT